jgi:hypothetical protein
MNWQELGKQVAEYAPLLGGVLGGPSGAAVGTMLASKFGTKETPNDIAAAIQADPNAALKLKEVELNNETKLQELYLKDKQNARLSHKESIMPAALSVALTVFVCLVVYLLFFAPVPDASKDVLFMLLGVVVKEWSNAMQYWYGTTRSSSDKTKLIAARS